jgi:hypothetical protein
MEPPDESRDELRERLDEDLRPPAQLRIETRGDDILMRGTGRPERRFSLSDTVTRMDASGTFTISARWSKTTLLVTSRYTSRARGEYHFTVDKTGALMDATVQFTDAMGVKLQLHSTYRRVEP